MVSIIVSVNDIDNCISDAIHRRTAAVSDRLLWSDVVKTDGTCCEITARYCDICIASGEFTERLNARLKSGWRFIFGDGGSVDLC
jgi:hypothetical protein